MLKEHTYTQPRKFTAAVQMAHYTLHSATRDPLIKDNSRYVTITTTAAPPGPTERERVTNKKIERMLQILLEHLL